MHALSLSLSLFLHPSGKKVQLATINLDTMGMAPPAVPKEIKAVSPP